MNACPKNQRASQAVIACRNFDDMGNRNVGMDGGCGVMNIVYGRGAYEDERNICVCMHICMCVCI